MKTVIVKGTEKKKINILEQCEVFFIKDIIENGIKIGEQIKERVNCFIQEIEVIETGLKIPHPIVNNTYLNTKIKCINNYYYVRSCYIKEELKEIIRDKVLFVPEYRNKLCIGENSSCENIQDINFNCSTCFYNSYNYLNWLDSLEDKGV